MAVVRSLNWLEAEFILALWSLMLDVVATVLLFVTKILHSPSQNLIYICVRARACMRVCACVREQQCCASGYKVRNYIYAL
jgi:hypothetical protein